MAVVEIPAAAAYAQAAGTRRGWFASFARGVALITVGNLLLAASFALIGGDWVANLVYGEAIGVAILILIQSGRRAMLRAGVFTLPRFLVWTTLSVVLGSGVGIVVASLCLGLPLARFVTAQGLAITGWIAFLWTALATWLGLTRARIELLREQSTQLALQREVAENAAMRARLQALQAQIEPHFLFNTLATLDSLIATDPLRARHLLAQLNRLLRGALLASRAERETLADQFALIEALLEVHAVRFGARLAYRVDLPPECAALAVPPMLLQPLVENAIRHGIEALREGGRIEVGATRADTQLLLRVADTGAGFGAHPARAGTGVGLANVRARLDALYGRDAALTIEENRPRGVIARIALPLAATACDDVREARA
jgi:sensor histidine kinase YesM